MASSGDSKYYFEVRVNDRYVKEYYHQGKKYIEGRKGSPYTLYFGNNSNKRVLVVFSVDGLCIMDGKTANKDSHGYIVNAYGSIEVPGWKINEHKVAQFRFSPKGDQDKSYVEELAAEGFNVDVENQGVIGCMVYREKDYPKYNYVQTVYGVPITPVWPQVQPWPYVLHQDPWNNMYYSSNNIRRASANFQGYQATSFCSNTPTMNSSAGMATASAALPQNASYGISQLCAPEQSLGTAFGEDKSFETVSVHFEHYEDHDWLGVIYYDTRINLQRKGIVFDEKPRHEPEAFPGMSKNGCYIPKSRR